MKKRKTTKKDINNNPTNTKSSSTKSLKELTDKNIEIKAKKKPGSQVKETDKGRKKFNSSEQSFHTIDGWEDHALSVECCVT